MNFVCVIAGQIYRETSKNCASRNEKAIICLVRTNKASLDSMCTDHIYQHEFD